MHRLLMVDDHAIVRRGLRAILEDELTDIEVEEAATGREALDVLNEKPADAVVLDIGLPDHSGLEVLKRIHRNWPHLPVLILSMYEENQYGLRVMRAGAAGYLTKASAPENIVVAVRKILSGARFVSESLAQKLATHLTREFVEEPHQLLSDREYQVFKAVASGKTASEIAAELYLSVKTVSTHRAHIMQKMGMRTNAELMHYAVSRGLVD